MPQVQRQRIQSGSDAFGIPAYPVQGIGYAALENIGIAQHTAAEQRQPRQGGHKRPAQRGLAFAKAGQKFGALFVAQPARSFSYGVRNTGQAVVVYPKQGRLPVLPGLRHARLRPAFKGIAHSGFRH